MPGCCLRLGKLKFEMPDLKGNLEFECDKVPKMLSKMMIRHKQKDRPKFKFFRHRTLAQLRKESIKNWTVKSPFFIKPKQVAQKMLVMRQSSQICGRKIRRRMCASSKVLVADRNVNG